MYYRDIKRVWGLGCRVWGLGFGGLGFGVWGFRVGEAFALETQSLSASGGSTEHFTTLPRPHAEHT